MKTFTTVALLLSTLSGITLLAHQAELRVGVDLRESPNRISDVPPNYPMRLRERNVQGTVFLDCVIDETGRVASVTPLRGDKRLLELAAESMFQWRYEVTVHTGIPSRVVTTESIAFSLGADRRAERELTKALEDDNAFVRHHAARRLGESTADAAAVSALEDALSDSASFVRAAAATALGEYGKRADSAVDTLMRATTDEDADVRLAAKEALLKVKPEK